MNSAERSTRIGSPVGRLLLVSDGVALTEVLFDDDPRRCAAPAGAGGGAALLGRARRELGEYFAGRRRRFTLPLSPAGTPFQRRVWQELLRIPYGATTTYGEIARALGAPGAVRAVGAACARNPLAIVIPCHRVVGAGGRLTGYAGGLERKGTLLDLEAGARGPRGAKKKRAPGSPRVP